MSPATGRNRRGVRPAEERDEMSKIKNNTEIRRTFTCRLPERLYRAIKVKAAREGIKTGELVIAALEQYLSTGREGGRG